MADDSGSWDLPGRARAQPRLVGSFARLIVRLFFRDLEVVGLEKVPSTGGVIFAANHVNGLVDPALLMGVLPRKPRFLAKSTLWSHPVVRPFLELAAAIPVFRRRDGADPAKNAETFTRCHEVLAAGGAIAIFPEGTSHSEPALIALKTGISRIVLEAESRFEGLRTAIVPVGLTFDDKERFRSRALVRIGEPVVPSAVVDRDEENRAAVLRLNEHVHTALAELTLNYPSWEEARWIERAAELWSHPRPELPGEAGLADRFAVRQAFIRGYRSLARAAPDRVAAVAEKVRSYDELLELHGLTDAQVASSYPVGRVSRFLVKSLGLLLVRMPLALIGTLINVAPYLLAGVIGRRLGRTPDVVATYKVFAGLLLYPAAWAALAAVGGWLGGGWWALAAFLAGPTTGFVALRFHERRNFFRREARAFLLLNSGDRSMTDLVRSRDDVLRSVQALADDYLQSSSGTASVSSNDGSQ